MEAAQPEVVIGIPVGASAASAKGAVEGAAAPRVAGVDLSVKPFRKRRLIVYSLVLGLFVVLALLAMTAMTIQSSIPRLLPVRIALDLSGGVSSLTALVDAKVQSSASAHHSVRLLRGTCSVDAACSGGSRCTLLMTEISEPIYPEETRAHFVAATTHAWPQNVRRAWAGRGRGLGVSCRLNAAVDLFKTGLVLEHESNWRFEDEALRETLWAGASNETGPAFTIKRGGRRQYTKGSNATLDGEFVAELKLPVGPVVDALEAVSVGVKAHVAYVESDSHALEGRLIVDDDLSIARNASAGYAVVSLPFTLFARAQVPTLAGYARKAAVHVAPMEERGGSRIFLREHSLSFEAAPESRAVAGILGDVHVLSWRREHEERPRAAGASGGGRALAAVGQASPGARRLIGFFGLEDVLGIELQALETRHSIYLDDEAFIGVDFKVVEGPPFVMALGAKVTRSIAEDIFDDGASIMANMTLTVNDVLEKMTYEAGFELYKEDGSVDTKLSFVAELDWKGEKLNVRSAVDGDFVLEFGAGVDAQDGVAFLHANLDNDLRVNASVAEDAASLRFHFDVMSATVGFGRTEPETDVEDFKLYLTMSETDAGDYSQSEVMNWPNPSSWEMVEIHATTTSSATLRMDHGRRRSVADGGLRTITAHMEMMPACSADGMEGVGILCCREWEDECNSCCGGMMQGEMMDMVGASIGEEQATTGLLITITDVAGTDSDMDFVAEWDTTDDGTPKASGKLRVVDDYHGLTVQVNESASSMLLGATVGRKESESPTVAGDINYMLEGTVYDNSSIPMFSGTAYLTESADGETIGVEWSLLDDVDSPITTGTATRSDTTLAATVFGNEDDGQVLDTAVYFKESNSNVEFSAHLDTDESEKLVSVEVAWQAAADWGGLLSGIAHINNSHNVFTTEVDMKEADDVRTITGWLRDNQAYVFGGNVSMTDGNPAPMAISATVYEGEGQEMLFQAKAEMTNPDYALDTNEDRSITLTNPIHAAGYLDVRDEGRVASLSWNVAKEVLGDGDNLSSTMVMYGSSVDEELLSLDATFDTSVAGQMSISFGALVDKADHAAMTGTLLYHGDYMSGNLLAEVNNDDQQAIWMTASRGFLVQPLKPSGYDALWLGFGTTINDETQLNLTNLYIERGPDIALSGIGWHFSLFELEERNWSSELVERYSHIFDIDFVPGEAPHPEGATANFGLTLEIKNLSTFSVTDVVLSVAAASNITSRDVVVTEVVYEIKTEYIFDAEVTEDEVLSAVAVANGVLQSQVTLVAVNGRRLASPPPKVQPAYRRLASQHYEVVIATTDAAQATSVMSTSADANALASALEVVAPDAEAPTVAVEPVAQITVETTLVSESDIAPMPPAGDAVSAQLSKTLGTDVSADVATTPAPSPAPTPASDDDGATPAPTPASDDGATPAPSPAPAPAGDGDEDPPLSPEVSGAAGHLPRRAPLLLAAAPTALLLVALAAVPLK